VGGRIGGRYFRYGLGRWIVVEKRECRVIDMYLNLVRHCMLLVLVLRAMVLREQWLGVFVVVGVKRMLKGLLLVFGEGRMIDLGIRGRLDCGRIDFGHWRGGRDYAGQTHGRSNFANVLHTFRRRLYPQRLCERRQRNAQGIGRKNLLGGRLLKIAWDLMPVI